jgi:hypothetical protein
MTTSTNPATGVEYYLDGTLEGQSVQLYVPVVNGQILNPNGVRWPFLFGGEHDQAAEYFELVPFVPVPFDPELRVIDEANSGRVLKPTTPTPPVGHPQGTYEETQTTKRRSKAELKTLAKGYAESNNNQLWPQENGYTEKLAYAEKQVAANNRLPEYTALIARHEALLQASFHNDARLTQLYAKIEEAGESGNIDDWPFSKMATLDANGQQLAGWVNGIEQ